jgi:hypothetical protein
VPARIGPHSIMQHKNLCDASGRHGSLAPSFCFIQVQTVKNCDIAIMANFRAWKLKAKQLSAGRMKLGCSLENPCLVLPLRLPGADGDGVSGYQSLKRLCVAGKPGASDGLACLKKIFLFARSCGPA